MITVKLDKEPWLNCVKHWRKENNTPHGVRLSPYSKVEMHSDSKFNWNITVKHWPESSDTAVFNVRSKEDLTVFLLKWS